MTFDLTLKGFLIPSNAAILPKQVFSHTASHSIFPVYQVLQRLEEISQIHM